MNEISVNVVQNQKKSREKISSELSQLIISNMNGGMSGEEVAKVVRLKPNTVRQVYRRYLLTGIETNQIRAKPRPTKLSVAQKHTICEWVDQNCTLTLKQLVAKALQEWLELLSISIMTIDRALKSFHYTVKRVSVVPETRNSVDVIERRYQYAVEYTQLKFDRKVLVFIDEMGVQIWSRASVGRAVRGQRANKTVKRIGSKNYSICAAMTSDSLFFFEINDRPYNTEHYMEFISQLCDHLEANQMTYIYLVMDNVRFHRTQEVKDLIEQR